MKYSALLTLAFSALVGTYVDAAPEQLSKFDQDQKEVKESAEAEKKLKIIPTSQVDSFVKEGMKIVNFCHKDRHPCDEFNPKWLASVEALNDAGIANEFLPYFDIVKVDCAADEEYCLKKWVVEEFPEVIVFENGTLDDEYEDDYKGEKFVQTFVDYVKYRLQEFKKGLHEVEGKKNPVKATSEKKVVKQKSGSGISAVGYAAIVLVLVVLGGLYYRHRKQVSYSSV